METKNVDMFDPKVRQALKENPRGYFSKEYPNKKIATDLEIKVYTNNKNTLYFIVPNAVLYQQMENIFAGVKTNAATAGSAGSAGTVSTAYSLTSTVGSFGTVSSAGSAGTAAIL